MSKSQPVQFAILVREYSEAEPYRIPTHVRQRNIGTDFQSKSDSTRRCAADVGRRHEVQSAIGYWISDRFWFGSHRSV